MRILGLFILLAGILSASAGLLVGLGFGSIYLAGFITTAGREAGFDLVLVLGAALLLLGLGWVLMRIGRALRPRPQP